MKIRNLWFEHSDSDGRTWPAEPIGVQVQGQPGRLKPLPDRPISPADLDTVEFYGPTGGEEITGFSRDSAGKRQIFWRSK